MDYFSDIWTGFISEQIVRQTVNLCELNCPGCTDSKRSPLLHIHQQLSLLDKLRCYFEEVRGSILPIIPQLYDQFQHKLAHSNDLDKDKELYTFNARGFLISITADALYYGRFITDMNDSYICEEVNPGNKRKSKPDKSKPGKKKAPKSKSRDQQPSRAQQQIKSRDLPQSRDLLQSCDLPQ